MRLIFGIPVDSRGEGGERSDESIRRMVDSSPLPLRLETAGEELSLHTREPRSIDIELTNLCNAACVFCPRQRLGQEGQMNWDVFKRTVDITRHANIAKVMFIGRGEPLLHPEFLSMVAYLKANTALSLEVFTNGLALTEEMVNGLADLNDEHLDIRVNVSLHSLVPATYRRLVGADLERAASAIRLLRRVDGALAHSVCFVKNKINEKEMNGLSRYLAGLGVRNADVSLIYNKGGLVADGALLDKAFYRRNLRRKAVDGWRRRRFCTYTYDHLSYFVNYRGEFALCHADFDDRYPLGDVWEMSFDEIDREVTRIEDKGGAPCCRRCTKRFREIFHGEDVRPEALAKDSVIVS